MDLIAEGLKQNLIRFEDDGKYIVYLPQNKRRNYGNPEEKVQTESFLRLVLIYKYPVQRIRQLVPVQMGSETKEADIIIYSDDELKSPLIVTECKQPDVNELEFRRAADQAVSASKARTVVSYLEGKPMAEWALKIRVKPRQVRLQKIRRKWASCSTAGTVSFSLGLLAQPAPFREYVIVHELLHLKVPNHGKLFKSLLRAYLPEYEEITTTPLDRDENTGKTL